MDFTFVPATKAGAFARIALVGGPGAGKTWTALELAQGLTFDGPIGVIDTERGSARKYADAFSFGWLGFTTYDPDDLTRAVIAAGRQGVGCLIVDTLSPFWAGTSGMLDRVGEASSSFEGWRKMRPIERRMIDSLLAFPGHVIVTMRTKVEYVVERNDAGKAEPKRVGLKPEQRDGIEYEFDAVADVDRAGGVFRVTKTRCPELAEYVTAKPTRDVGARVQAWLDRDAVGLPLNPQTVRDWAIERDDQGRWTRTPAELGERHAALAAVGQLDAAVYDHTDQLTGVGELLVGISRDIKRTARQAERQAAQTQNVTGQ